MDDLSGLDWSSSANTNSNSNPAPNPSAFAAHPTLRPTPSPSASGRSTPLNLRQSSNAGRVLKVPSKPATPANDSFASLLGPGSGKNTSNVSLGERQKQLQDERNRQVAEQHKKLDAHFGGGNNSFWDSHAQNGSGTSSGVPSPAPAARVTPLPAANSAKINGSGEDDTLAAFNASAPVDRSSHFPPPQQFDRGRSTPAQPAATSNQANVTSNNDAFQFNDDDDPFGLSEVKQKTTSPPPQAAPADDDDDVLGLLGKPVSELPKPQPKEEPELPPRGRQEEDEEHTDPRDNAVAELVDMGFPADKAAMALARTEGGKNIQAAVGILLNEAHEESRQKARGQTRGSERADSRDTERRKGPAEGRSDDSMPAWARQERGGSRQRATQSPTQEKDLAQTASEMGASFLKGANSLWKAGQKRVQKAVAEFQQDGGDPSQPKWMRDAQAQDGAKARKKPQPNLTDEATMLEDGGRPQKPPRPQKSSQPASVDKLQRKPSPANRDDALPPRPSASRMTRQDLEDQTPEFYVSPARRRGKAAPQSSAPPSEPPSRPATHSPLASTSPSAQSKNPFKQPQQPTSKPSTPSTTQKRPTPVPQPKPKPPPRQIPPISPSALQQSNRHRLSGTESFKRGDFATAHTSYTSALSPLPSAHPLSIILYCNRSLCSLKTGDAKAAIADAESALAIIGPARGDGERIELGGREGSKEMRDFWGKAVTRKAEGLEHLERYSEALGVWKDAVEAGVGGSAAIEARQRCERAANPRAASAVGKPATPRPQPPKVSTLSELGVNGNGDSEAVKRMREANRAAEKADDEKFALTDAVDAKLVAWKGSKSDNLRALLGSLDKVLWPEARCVFNSTLTFPGIRYPRGLC